MNTITKILIAVLLIATCMWPFAVFYYGWHSARNAQRARRTVIVL